MEAIRYGCTIGLGLLSIFMSTMTTEWKGQYRAWIMMAAFLLTIGLVYSSWKVDDASKKYTDSMKDQLITALTKLDDKSTALEKEIRAGNKLQEENLNLQKQNMELQKEAAHGIELEKLRLKELHAKEATAERSRDVNFWIPYKKLKGKAIGSIRQMNESFYDTKYFREEAGNWFREMLALLEKHCSDPKVAGLFKHPHRLAGIPGLFSDSWDKRFREEYPFILNPEWIRCAAFYRLSLEELQKEDLSSCK